MSPNKNILIIHTGFIGDTVLSLSIPTIIKRWSTNSFVSVVAESTSAQLYDDNEHIKEVIPFNKKSGKVQKIKNFFSIQRYIKKQNFDTALIFSSLSYSTILWAYLGNIPTRIGYTHSVLSNLLTHKVVMDRSLHMIDRYLQLVGAMGYDLKTLGKEKYEIKIKQSFDHFQLFSDQHHLQKYRYIIGISPGSRWATKRWEQKKIAALASKLISKYSAKVLLFGNKDDTLIIKEILYLLKDQTEHVIDLCDKTTLHNLYYLIRRCSLLITNDSCSMHFGSVANTPMVSIWGSTVTSLGFAPFSQQSSIVEIDLPCRPCGKNTHGGNQCPLKHFKCMKDITVDHVLNACENYLK